MPTRPRGTPPFISSGRFRDSGVHSLDRLTNTDYSIGVKTSTISHKIITSPVGPITLTANADALLCVACEGDQNPFQPTPQSLKSGARNKILATAELQFNLYFQGKLKKFDIPLSLNGTDFQKRVWTELKSISFGELISYSKLAAKVGNPKATRAVASAVGKNLHLIVIPCQRVIGIRGHMSGFASGLQKKRFLLSLEGHDVLDAPTPEKERIEIRRDSSFD